MANCTQYLRRENNIQGNDETQNKKLAIPLQKLSTSTTSQYLAWYNEKILSYQRTDSIISTKKFYHINEKILTACSAKTCIVYHKWIGRCDRLFGSLHHRNFKVICSYIIWIGWTDVYIRANIIIKVFLPRQPPGTLIFPLLILFCNLCTVCVQTHTVS